MPIESTSLELQHSKKSLDSTVPIDSNREAISVRIATESPELRCQVHATSGKIRANSTTGDYYPHDGGHPTEISVQMDGGIAGGENSSEKRTQIPGVHESSGNVNSSPPLETHLAEISSNFDGENITNNHANRSNDSMKNVYEGTSRKMHNTEGSNSLPTSPAEINIQPAANHQLGARTTHEAKNAMQENGLEEQQANDQVTRILNSENSSDEAHSSNFSFGIKGNSNSITPIPIIYPMQVAAAKDKPTEDNGQVQRQRKGQPGPLKQSTGKELQTGIAAAKINTQSLVANTEAQSHNVRNEHISRTVEESKQVQNQGHKDKEGKKDQLKEINQQGGNNRTHDSNDRANVDYHSNFPKISNNFTRYVSNPQRNRDDDSNVNNDIAQNNGKQPHGIDLSLPLPHSPNIIYVDAENSDEVCGGMDGGCQENLLTCRKRVTKGGSLTHVLHEVVHTDHMIDLRASATPISVQNSQNVQENVNKIHKGQIADTGQVRNEPVYPTDQGTEVQNRGTNQIQNTTDPPSKGTTGNLQDQNEAQRKTPNNKSQGKIRQTHKSADNDEYNVVPSKDEYDQDTQSLGENSNEEDETSIHLIKAFGSTLQQEELQEVTDQ
uniref:GJ10070 n=1 Tax=Solanum tuberosum TaxID=4113 RepID=M1DHI5_SOLTU